VPVDASQSPCDAFKGLAVKTVTLTVSARPTLDDEARDVVVEPLEIDVILRYRAWIDKNRQYVAERTVGRVGYVYVPSTGIDGQNDLVRQFQGKFRLPALILDERWNSGGQIPTRFIEMLNRPATNYWARRDGRDWPWPPDAHFGPKCMLINGLSGSGGDAFPWYFRQAGLGQLIGTRTWGGEIWLSANNFLVDGGIATAAENGVYGPEGEWLIEGHGVEPDIVVDNLPHATFNGDDAQLEEAVKHLLQRIEEEPIPPFEPPAGPDKSFKPVSEQE
jgi:tricorn protease